MDQDERARQIRQHLDAIRQLQSQAATDQTGGGQWPPKRYYVLFHVLVGMMLGFIGAAASLLMNVLGSLLVGQHPLELIRVYLTFPMGEAARNTESGKVLFVGCCLYLITGGLYGIAFHIVMSVYFHGAPLLRRFLVGSAMGLGLWVFNFYLVLSWLQPLLLGDNWIVREVPWWVGGLTHLVFAWTMLGIEFWGRFEPLSSSGGRAAPAVSAGGGA